MQVVRFRFDGSPINENDTPSSLEMEEGDTIEVYQQQTGGAQQWNEQSRKAALKLRKVDDERQN